MKTDLYTKFVLTIIAISLTGIAIQMTTKEAHARYAAEESGFKFTQSGALIVAVCDANSLGTYQDLVKDNPNYRCVKPK